MNESITYHAYSPGNEKGIIELLCLVFSRWRQYKNPLENWTWKHFEGPTPSEVYVAKDGEQIVGANHRIVLDIKRARENRSKDSTFINLLPRHGNI